MNHCMNCFLFFSGEGGVFSVPWVRVGWCGVRVGAGAGESEGGLNSVI